MMSVEKKIRCLNSEQLDLLNQAVSISEDLISNRFHLTSSSWKKYRWDIKTLKDLRPEEIVPDVFAHVVRYGRPIPPDGLRMADFYKICVQDHNIISAMERDPGLKFLPLTIYVVTHELLHLVRFYKFLQHFDVNEDQRAAEEILVHRLTYEILLQNNIPEMNDIFNYYADHREFCLRSDGIPTA